MDPAGRNALAAILVSAFASLLIYFSGRRPNLREFWTLAAATVKFLLVLSLYPYVTRGINPEFTLFEITAGTRAFLRVDALGLFFALLSSGLWVLTSFYNIGYMRSLNERHQSRYFACFALSLSATIGIAFAGDLLSFFIFYEILTLATYPLVVHKESREAVLAGRKYLVYSLSAGTGLLFAIGWIFNTTGSTAFTPSGFVAGHFDTRSLCILFALLIYGCGVKATLFPVHAWLPTAMVAPTPVSALLHAVAVVKAGVFGILRMVGYVIGPGVLAPTGLWLPLAIVASFIILAASMMALVQDNLKRLLAYSTISQLSYIILGAAVLSPTAFTASVMHMANHAFMKITLFFCAGVIYVKTHKENISEMKGIGYTLPWTMAAFTAASFGLAGFPPFCGFISKWLLCRGALEADKSIYVFVYLASALLNGAYFFPIVIRAYKKADQELSGPIEKPDLLLVPALATTLLIILFGVVPFAIGSQYHLARLSAEAVLGVSP